jgi:hypothetical protein
MVLQEIVDKTAVRLEDLEEWQLRGSLTLMMDHLSVWEKQDLVSSLGNPPAIVNIVEEETEPLVEHPNLVDCLVPHHDRRKRRLLDKRFLIVREPHHPPMPEQARFGKQLRQQKVMADYIPVGWQLTA